VTYLNDKAKKYVDTDLIVDACGPPSTSRVPGDKSQSDPTISRGKAFCNGRTH
jgi:hypothetical protein